MCGSFIRRSTAKCDSFLFPISRIVIPGPSMALGQQLLLLFHTATPPSHSQNLAPGGAFSGQGSFGNPLECHWWNECWFSIISFPHQLAVTKGHFSSAAGKPQEFQQSSKSSKKVKLRKKDWECRTLWLFLPSVRIFWWDAEQDCVKFWVLVFYKCWKVKPWGELKNPIPAGAGCWILVEPSPLLRMMDFPGISYKWDTLGLGPGWLREWGVGQTPREQPQGWPSEFGAGISQPGWVPQKFLSWELSKIFPWGWNMGASMPRNKQEWGSPNK